MNGFKVGTGEGSLKYFALVVRASRGSGYTSEKVCRYLEV